MSTAPVRCLVVGAAPEPDLSSLRELAGPVELVRDRDGTAPGDFDCVWRLYGGRLRGATHDPLEVALDGHPEIRWVHSISAGIDHLRPLLQRHREVVVTHSAGVVAAPIAEFVVGCLLQHCKRAAHLAELQRERRFEAVDLRELADLRVVILGLGAIGSRTAQLLSAFGCDLIGIRRHPGRGGPVPDVRPPGELAAACSGADALVLAAPFTPATGRLVDDAVLSRLAPGSVLVNVARGELVDEAALLRRLADGPLGAAYLDAFAEEPLAASSPLWGAEGVFISPHVSWSSPNFGRRAVELFASQLRRFRQGEPLLNVADVTEGY